MLALITGGSSYNATHLARALHAAGHGVRMLAPANSAPEQPGDFDIRYGDPATHALDGLLQDVEIVYHLSETVFTKDREALHKTNVTATRRLLEAAGKTPGTHFVLQSSIAATYLATNAYSTSKRCAEALLVEQETVPYTIVRPCLIHGPEGGSPALQRFRSYLLKNRRAVLPDGGHAMKDPLGVEAYATALANIPGCEAAIGTTYTLGGGGPINVHKIAETLLKNARHPTTLINVPSALLRAIRPLLPPPGFTRHALATLTENAVPEPEEHAQAQRDLKLPNSPLVLETLDD